MICEVDKITKRAYNENENLQKPTANIKVYKNLQQM
jgi:hypothetical protein